MTATPTVEIPEEWWEETAYHAGVVLHTRESRGYWNAARRRLVRRWFKSRALWLGVVLTLAISVAAGLASVPVGIAVFAACFLGLMRAGVDIWGNTAPPLLQVHPYGIVTHRVSREMHIATTEITEASFRPSRHGGVQIRLRCTDDSIFRAVVTEQDAKTIRAYLAEQAANVAEMS